MHCCISIESSFQGQGTNIINFNFFKGTLGNLQKNIPAYVKKSNGLFVCTILDVGCSLSGQSISGDKGMSYGNTV